MSPLTFFRRYQKSMLAVAAVGAMFAFGILPIVSEWQRKAPDPGGGGVAGGSGAGLNEVELQRRQQVRRDAARFQQTVIQTAVERGAEPRSMVIPPNNSPESIVESMLLANEAANMGVTVGDDAVLEHLKSGLADGAIDPNELALILKQTGQTTQTQLFDEFKRELAAQQVRILANGAAFDGRLADTAVTPRQAFEYYRRLNRRMQTEVIELPVEDFVGEVTEEPTDAEVAELFEKYKNVFPSETRPTPGFREPPRAAFQWVKADFPTILEREIEKVTDDEIKARYEQDKESYRKISLPTTGDLSLPETDSEETQALDELPFESTDEEVGGEGEEAEDVDAEGTDVEDAVGEGDDSLSGESGEDDLQEEESGNAEASDEGESEEETGSESEEEAEGDKPQYQSIDEVREDIATKIARPRAKETSDTALAKVREAMSKYFNNYMYWDTTPDDEQGDPPTLPDLQKLANDNGLIYGTVPLISALDVDKYELGRAYNVDFSTGQFRPIPFYAMAFNPSLPRYQARDINAKDSFESTFVFWKVDDKEAYVPSLDEARPKVVKHWKMKKAIDKAKAAGQARYLAKLPADQSLKVAAEGGVFGDDGKGKVLEPNEFTWMSSGVTMSGQGAPQLNRQIQGVKVPGEQFMKDVSKLASGESTVTINAPESHVYVVYMKGVTGNDEDLRRGFLTQGVNVPILHMARQDNSATAIEWYSGREKETGMRWTRAVQ